MFTRTTVIPKYLRHSRFREDDSPSYEDVTLLHRVIIGILMDYHLGTG
jgi:hypothetical protein